MHLRRGARRCLPGVAVALPATAILASQFLPFSAFASDLPDATSTSMIFVGVAAADGMRMQLIVPGAPASNNVIDAGGPSAQALATSAGTVRGFAAFVDPGETPRSAPSTAAGVLASNGLPLPFQPPDFPLVVNSHHPGRPGQEVGSGPIHLTTASSEAGAESLAAFGSPGGEDGGGFSTTASVKTLADGVVSRALFRSEALAAGPVALGRVVATAEMAMGGDGRLTPSSALEVTGAEIADTKFSLTGDGFIIGTNTVPVPIGEGLKSLNQALAPTGISVQYAAERKMDTGVVAPVLQVTVKSPSGGPFQGAYTLAVGGVSASLQGARAEGDDYDAAAVADSTIPAEPDFSPTVEAEVTGTPGAASPSAARQESASLAPVGPAKSSSAAGRPAAGTRIGAETVDPGTAGQPYAAGGFDGPSTSIAPATVTAASPPQPTTVRVLPAASASSTGGAYAYRLGSVYGMTAAAALLCLVVMQLVARRGVRRPWNS